jgi:hypothetical protein
VEDTALRLLRESYEVMCEQRRRFQRRADSHAELDVIIKHIEKYLENIDER